MKTHRMLLVLLCWLAACGSRGSSPVKNIPRTTAPAQPDQQSHQPTPPATAQAPAATSVATTGQAAAVLPTSTRVPPPPGGPVPRATPRLQQEPPRPNSGAPSSPPSPPTPAEAPRSRAAAGPTPQAGRSEPSATSSSGEPGPVTPQAGARNANLQEFLNGLPGLAGWTIIPLAHFRRGDRHVAVLWPAINGAGRVVDATVVAVPLRQTGTGQLEEAGRRWVVRERHQARAALRDFFGSADYRPVNRQAGAALADLGPRLVRESRAFTEAVAAGQRQRAQQAAVAFSRLLPVDRAAHEPSVARLLWMAAAHQGGLEHLGTNQQGEGATVRLRIRRGRVTLRTVEARAAPVAARPDRWVIVAYE